ncbi:MAG: low molecular weight phosphotyrosine protein phosphatase, partial [Clostridia bacterium]|nr:low molecular weight phosphotyrosine protein phosphatase [Clostridia bacterium]
RAGEFEIASRATSTEEIWNGLGNPVYPQARNELKKHGISCDGKRAVQLRKDDYGEYDKFICMDDNNCRNALRIFGSDSENKLVKLMSFAESNADVADPWYSGDFSTAYSDILKGCNGVLRHFSL